MLGHLTAWRSPGANTGALADLGREGGRFTLPRLTPASLERVIKERVNDEDKVRLAASGSFGWGRDDSYQ
jgi:hypothetical protein